MPPLRPETRAETAPDTRSRARSLTLLAGGSLGLALMAATMAESASHAAVTETHGYSFFGELVYGPDFEYLNYVNPDAPKGGEIAIWGQGTFDSFNIYTRSGRSAGLSSIGHEQLLTTFADDPVASYCFLCTTMEYPEDLAWVIFNLRDDVTFVDGSNWTAEDLKWTHELFMEQGLPSFRAAFGAMIEDVEVLDTYRIKFTFAPDSPERDRITTAGIYPAFSQAWFEENGVRLDESSDEPFMGTGPYMLGEFDFNRRVVYERNPNYWAEDLPVNVGRNNFDSIRIEYFADGNAAFEGFKSGAYTFRSENSSLQWATGYDFPAVENGWVIKTELDNGSIAPGQSFVFNLRRPQFQDIRVRQAIGLMFNFEWSNATLFYGLYDRVESFWGKTDMQASGTPSEGELAILRPLVDEGLLDAEILTAQAVVPPVLEPGENRPSRRTFREASQLLDEAGWTVGADGMRMKDGVVLRVEFLESSPAFDRVINPFVENLRALGIDARLDRVDPSQETDRARNYDFDMTTHSFSMDLEPSTGLKQWFGTEAAAESTRNLMGLMDPAVDRIIDAVVSAESEDEMKDAVRALDRVLRAKVFWVPQWFKGVHTVAYYDMFRHPDELPPYSRGELDFWWFDQEAFERLDAAGAF